MRLIKKYCFIISLALACPLLSHAQFKSNINDTTVNAKLLTFSYAFQFPFGDMADRFGVNNNLAAGFYFKLSHNYLLGVEAGYLFGGSVREDTILNYLYTASGGLIGIDGYYETVFLFERGTTFLGKFGKIFPVGKSNPNSGITLMAGVGFLQHRIKLSSPNNTLPNVLDDYAKGYDRLTNGLALSQYVGYTHLDKRKLVNFNIGLEATEGFTQNRRDWNFDQMKKDEQKRFDVLLGIKLSWILPFYGSGEERVYTF
ncbi:MAG: hypothetical protein IPO83_04860 [Chitinophagaceae bacterium]|nr:hypothetical protein [Chitinophagaceae bacterium]